MLDAAVLGREAHAAAARRLRARHGALRASAWRCSWLLLVAVEGRQAVALRGPLAAAALYGLVGITGFNLFVWIGLGYTRPEHASIILALQTPLTALAVWLRAASGRRRFTLGCVAVAIAGVVLVITKGDLANALAGGSLLGDALIFLGAVSWVTYTLAASRFPGWSPLRFTVLTCIPGGVGLVDRQRRRHRCRRCCRADRRHGLRRSAGRSFISRWARWCSACSASTPAARASAR